MERPLFRKPELERYAKLYANLVLGTSGAMPEDVTAMTATEEWKKASSYQKNETAKNVKEQARGLLIGAGYSREVVYRNIP